MGTSNKTDIKTLSFLKNKLKINDTSRKKKLKIVSPAKNNSIKDYAKKRTQQKIMDSKNRWWLNIKRTLKKKLQKESAKKEKTKNGAPKKFKKIQVLIRISKLSNVICGQYLDGSPGKDACCCHVHGRLIFAIHNRSGEP